MADKTHSLNGAPLTQPQQEIWLSQKLHPDAPIYNVGFAYTIKGNLDVSRFVQSYQLLHNRTDTLRMVFREENGEVVQVVEDDGEAEVELLDFRQLSAEELRDELSKRLRRPIRLDKKASYSYLIRGKQEEYIWLLIQHHLVTDVASGQILLERLSQIYENLDDHSSRNWPQYLDVIAGLPLVDKDSLPASREIDGLLDSHSLSKLPFDPRATRRRVALSDKRTMALENLMKKPGFASLSPDLTRLQLITTITSVCLHRFTSDKAIRISLTNHTRTTPELKATPGTLIRILPLQIAVGGDDSFTQVFKDVRQHLFDSLKTPNVRTPGELSHVFLNYMPDEFCDFAGFPTEVEWLHPGFHEPENPLRIHYHQFNARTPPEFMFDFNEQAFPEALQNAFLDLFFQTLDVFMRDAESLVASYSMVADAKTFMSELNDTAHPIDQNMRLHDGLLRFAKETPDAVALQFGSASMSYKELDERSSQVASFLAQKGVQPDDVVAVVSRRSFDLLVAIFGILRAGGAYLPIDPDQPSGRVDYFLQDSAVQVVLLGEEVPTPREFSGTVHRIQEISEVEGSELSSDRSAVGNLAYVIYTSGSTGKPKGAMIEHRSIVNRLLWMADQYGFTAGDAQILKTPITFDVSVHELFLWSLVGGRLVIAEPGAEKDPWALMETVQRHEVNHIHFVPTMLDAFLAYFRSSGVDPVLRSLKSVYCSGEALAVSTISEFRSLVGEPFGVGLHNLYGPTEAAVDVSFYDCGELGDEISVPIGKPVWNTQLYILDGYMQPVSKGVTGELYIGGIQVGRGYINKPDLTEASFVPDPFSNLEGSKLYRTGDLARWKPDGNIEYLGRNDFQIKVRGVRIEPAEIVDAVLQQPGIQQATVCLKEIGPSMQLCCYVISVDELDVNQLRSRLESELPSQYVPQHFVVVAEFPTTSSGKIDQKKLPPPELNHGPSTATCYQNAKEQQLGEIWESVLQREDIDRGSNFFDLGGDSIMAIQIVARAAESGLQFTPALLFENQTIAELAVIVKESDVPRTSHERVRGPFALAPIQKWFFEQAFADPDGWSQSLAVEVESDLDVGAVERTVAALQDSHDIFRARFVERDSEWSGVIEEDFAKAHVEELNGPLTSDMEQSLNRKLDIQSGRFMAVGIHRTPEGGTQLLMVIHHLVMDAVSWPILLLDLSSLLKTITGQEKPRLLKPSGSYAQWTEDLLETAAAIEPDTIAFWEDTTDTDAENGPSYDASGHQMMETLSFQLSKADTSRFLDLIRRKNRANPQHVLLAALAATFREWHDTKQVVFELEGHGREATKLGTDTSHTIGWFTSKFPLALDLEKSSSTEDILRTVSSKMDRLPMNGAGYGLVRYLHADEKVRSNTTVTKSVHAGFNYLGVAEQLVPAESGFRLIKPLSLVSSVENHSPLPIDIHAMIFQSTLKLEWRYDARLHDRSVIEKHGRRCMEHLGALIETETKQTKTTVADFSQAGLDKSKLSNLAAVLDKLK